MICARCDGSGGFVHLGSGRPRFTWCVQCQGTGAIRRTGPREIVMPSLELAKYAKHKAKMDKLRQRFTEGRK